MGINFSKHHYSKTNSTSKAESSFPNIIIPDDIIVEILSRVPLDSLPRFACVSKQWRSLTSNTFVAKTGSPTVLLVSDSRAYSFSPHSIDQNCHQEVDVRSIHVPWKLSESGGKEFKILGSCNGLVLMNIDEDLFLWNPLTRFFKKVLASDQLCDRDHYHVCSGLCYDSTSEEYKAVLGYGNTTPGYSGDYVMVGSFRSKSWTMVSFPYNVPTWISGSIVNGNLHWFAANSEGKYFFAPHQIIYFDAKIDKFEKVPMPPEHRGDDGDFICGLGVLDGNLCMSRWDRPGNNESNVEVLVMKEYAVAKSWTILFVVSDGLTLQDPYDDLTALGFTKNGEVLTRVSKLDQYGKYDTHIRAFNLTDNSHRRIPIPEDPRFYVIAHEDCLITPTDNGWEEDELKGEAKYVVHTCTGDLRKYWKKDSDSYWNSLFINPSRGTNMNGEPNSEDCQSDSDMPVDIVHVPMTLQLIKWLIRLQRKIKEYIFGHLIGAKDLVSSPLSWGKI